MQIGEANLLAVGNAEAPIHASRRRPCSGGRLVRPAMAKPSGPEHSPARPIPASSRIHRFIVQIIRRTRRLRHILPRASARIDHPLRKQLLPSVQITCSPFTLHVRSKRPTAIRTFRPLDPEPSQILEHRLHKLRATPLRIQILIAENELSAALRRTPGCDPKRARMPQMEQPSGRRRKPSAIGSGIGFDKGWVCHGDLGDCEVQRRRNGIR
jgi:hypothetical protein